MRKQQLRVEETNEGPFYCPCWRCGEEIPTTGYNVYLAAHLKDPIYHPTILSNYGSCAPTDDYRWLCGRCVRIEGYIW